MSIKQAYNQWSTTYDADRNRTRDLDQAVTRQLLAGRRYRAIIELGCGTGKNTALFSQIGQTVQALDFSASMIGRARAKTSAPNVTFSVADITQPWPSADRSADLVACNLVLEHIEHLSFIYSEASRTLVESGRFFACELHPFRQCSHFWRRCKPALRLKHHQQHYDHRQLGNIWRRRDASL